MRLTPCDRVLRIWRARPTRDIQDFIPLHFEMCQEQKPWKEYGKEQKCEEKVSRYRVIFSSQMKLLQTGVARVSSIFGLTSRSSLILLGMVSTAACEKTVSSTWSRA